MKSLYFSSTKWKSLAHLCCSKMLGCSIITDYNEEYMSILTAHIAQDLSEVSSFLSAENKGKGVWKPDMRNTFPLCGSSWSSADRGPPMLYIFNFLNTELPLLHLCDEDLSILTCVRHRGTAAVVSVEVFLKKRLWKMCRGHRWLGWTRKTIGSIGSMSLMLFTPQKFW